MNRIFVVDTLNFCFWSEPDSEPFIVSYKNNNYTGYWALCAAINRAIDEDIPIINPSFYSTVDLKTLNYIFRSETTTPISLLEQRMQVLNQAGTVLQNNFQCDVQNLISAANGSAQKLVQLVVSNFKSYDDSVPLANYPYLKHGLPSHFDLPAFCFYKRAQILVADIWASFAATKLYRFKDISELTMFADYRVPQILNWLGTIKYSDKLMHKLKSGEHLISGGKDEIEIRACSIYAVELIRKQLDRLINPSSQPSEEGVRVNSVLIDFALWDYAKAHNNKMANVPIHLVKSIFY